MGAPAAERSLPGRSKEVKLPETNRAWGRKFADRFTKLHQGVDLSGMGEYEYDTYEAGILKTTVSKTPSQLTISTWLNGMHASTYAEYTGTSKMYQLFGRTANNKAISAEIRWHGKWEKPVFAFDGKRVIFSSEIKQVATILGLIPSRPRV